MAWAGLCTALALASLAADASGRPLALVWHATAWQHHPWMLWTASLAHLSPAHMLVNLAALLVVAVLGGFLCASWPATVAVLLAWPVGTVALVWWPQIGYYSGMSGLLMAMLAVLWIDTTWQTAMMRLRRRLAAQPRVRPGDSAAGSWTPSVVLFAVLAIKLLVEHAWSQPIVFDPNWGFNVVQAAHLSGALAGAASAVLVRTAIAIRA